MKILVSDFDLTFYTNEYLENIKLVNNFVAKGNMFIIATGRNITQLKKDIKGFNINYEYLICNDGGIIFDKNDNLIYRKDIDQNVTKPIFDILNIDKNIITTYIDDSIKYTTDTNDVANAIIATYIDRQLALNTLDKILKEFNTVHGYLSENWINITDKTVNKATSIEHLKNILNIDHDSIYTIGDNINDIEMLNSYHGYLIEASLEKIEKCGEGVVKSFKDLIDKINESNID